MHQAAVDQRQLGGRQHVPVDCGLERRVHPEVVPGPKQIAPSDELGAGGGGDLDVTGHQPVQHQHAEVPVGVGQGPLRIPAAGLDPVDSGHQLSAGVGGGAVVEPGRQIGIGLEEPNRAPSLEHRTQCTGQNLLNQRAERLRRPFSVATCARTAAGAFPLPSRP